MFGIKKKKNVLEMDLEKYNDEDNNLPVVDDTVRMFPKISWGWIGRGATGVYYINLLCHVPNSMEKPERVVLFEGDDDFLGVAKMQRKLVARIRGFYQCSDEKVSPDGNRKSFFIKKTQFLNKFEFECFTNKIKKEMETWEIEISTDIYSKKLKNGN